MFPLLLLACAPSDPGTDTQPLPEDSGPEDSAAACVPATGIRLEGEALPGRTVQLRLDGTDDPPCRPGPSPRKMATPAPSTRPAPGRCRPRSP